MILILAHIALFWHLLAHKLKSLCYLLFTVLSIFCWIMTLYGGIFNVFAPENSGWNILFEAVDVIDLIIIVCVAVELIKYLRSYLSKVHQEVVTTENDLLEEKNTQLEAKNTRLIDKK